MNGKKNLSQSHIYKELQSVSLYCSLDHTGYLETTNTLDNLKHKFNQQAGIGCKYLSGNNLPRINLIRGKLFLDRYLLSLICDKLFPDRYLLGLIHGKLFPDRFYSHHMTAY